MKGHTTYSAILIICLSLCLPHDGLAVEAGVTLSAPILIPHAAPVHVQLPDGTIEEWTSSQLLLPGIQLAEQNTAAATVVCEDLTRISIEPGHPIRCPFSKIQSPDVIMLAASTKKTPYRPPWSRLPARNPKGPEDVDTAYEQAITIIDDQAQQSQDPNFQQVLCYLYAEAYRDDEAYVCYQEVLEQFEQAEDVSGQGFVQYQLALLFWGWGQKIESIRRAETALGLYQQADTYDGTFQEAERAFLELAQLTQDTETQAFAQHHLALLYQFYHTAARQWGRQAIDSYETLEQPEMIQHLQDLLSEDE